MFPVYTSTDGRSQTSRGRRNKSLEWSMAVNELPYQAVHVSVGNAYVPKDNKEKSQYHSGYYSTTINGFCLALLPLIDAKAGFVKQTDE